MDIWTISYIVLLIISISVAIYHRDSDYIWIAVLMIINQIGCMLIGYADEKLQPPLDFLNDVISCWFLIRYFSDLLVARVMMILYAVMAIFAYTPIVFELYSQETYLEIMGAISFIIAFVFLGGISSGTTRHSKRRHDSDILDKSNRGAMGTHHNRTSDLAPISSEVQKHKKLPKVHSVVPKRKSG